MRRTHNSAPEALPGCTVSSPVRLSRMVAPRVGLSLAPDQREHALPLLVDLPEHVRPPGRVGQGGEFGGEHDERRIELCSMRTTRERQKLEKDGVVLGRGRGKVRGQRFQKGGLRDCDGRLAVDVGWLIHTRRAFLTPCIIRQTRAVDEGGYPSGLVTA